MQVFKRTFWGLIISLVTAVFAAFAAYYIGGIFIESPAILGGIVLVIFAFLMYSALIDENIKLVLDESGVLSYYKMGKLRQQFNIHEHAVGYRRKRESGVLGSVDIQLHLVRYGGEETELDVSPIGNRQFEELYSQLKILSPDEPEVMTARSSTEVMRTQ